MKFTSESTASMHSDGGRRWTGIRGFTLVEVLVAVLVLSVGVLGVAGLKRVDVRVPTGSAAERERPFAAARLHRRPTLSGGGR